MIHHMRTGVMETIVSILAITPLHPLAHGRHTAVSIELACFELCIHSRTGGILPFIARQSQGFRAP
jgi:hypothetical protein